MEVIGRRGRKKPPKPWISEEVIALAERKRIARCTGKDQEYKDLKLEERRRIRCDRRKWLEDKCKHIESSGRNHDVREVFNTIKSTKKSSFRPNQACINAAHGTTLTEKEDVLLQWFEDGQQLFGQPSGDQGCAAWAENGAEELPSPLITPEPVPLLAEVEQAILSLKERKAPGLDGIVAELIQHGSSVCVLFLHKLCLEIWKTGRWPKAWKHQEIVCYPKLDQLRSVPTIGPLL